MASEDEQPGLVDYGFESICAAPSTHVAADNRFAGKTIIITGAGGQFGREGCLYFAKRGARVAGLDMSKPGLEGTDEAMKVEFGETAYDFKTYICDITDAAQVDQII